MFRTILVFFLLINSVNAQDIFWNRYTTKNFVILSIDNEQGKWLSNNIEELKTWCNVRWGFKDIDLNHEFRIFCVPNKNLLNKLFDLKESKIEFRDKLTVIWLVLNDKPTHSVNPFLTQAILGDKLDFWTVTGISLLNTSNSEIRGHLIDLFSILRKRYFNINKILSMKKEDYLNLTEEDKSIFDIQAVVLCLFLKKEFGENKFQRFILTKDIKIYKFSNYEEFDKIFLRYMQDLSFQNMKQKIPDSYLDVKAK